MPRIAYNADDTDLEHHDWEAFDRTIRSDAPSWDEVDPDGDDDWTEWEDTDPDHDPENA
jgi:hypothetical protein